MSGKKECPFCGEKFADGKPLNVHKIYCEDKAEGKSEVKSIDGVYGEESSNIDSILSLIKDLDNDDNRNLYESVVKELKDIDRRLDSLESGEVDSSGDEFYESRRLVLELVRHYNNRVVGRLNDIQEELVDNGFIGERSSIPEFKFRDKIGFGGDGED